MKESRYMRQQYLVQIALFCWMMATLVAAPSGIEQKLYILNSNSNDMTVVDVSTNQVIKTIEVGELPHGIAATKSQDLLYVSTILKFTIYINHLLLKILKLKHPN